MIQFQKRKSEVFIMQNEVISDARKRVISLLDDKSFVEFDELFDGGVIAGYGTIGLRPVCVFAQDSSVMSGAITSKNCEKICKVIDMATKTGVPLIGFYDSIGAKIDEGVKVFAGLQNVLSKLANASGVIPQIAIVTGAITGVATFAASFSDFVFMIDKNSKLFVNSPLVLTSKLGRDFSADSKFHYEKTGICSFCCTDEDDCNAKIKELLEFLPDNNLADTDIIDSDDINRTCDGLVAGESFVKDIIDSICDDNKFFEVGEGFAKNIMVGLSRIGGRVAGIVANNRLYNEGKLNINGIEKATKFIRFCDAFGIPVVTLIDTDGFEVSIEEEERGLAKESARLLFAYSDATITKVNVIFGKAFGGTSLLMGTLPDVTMAWEGTKVCVTNPISAVNVLYDKEIADAESPVEFRDEKLSEYMENEATLERAEMDGFVNAIISPSETRKRIISALDMFSGKREIRSVRRHESVAF